MHLPHLRRGRLVAAAATLGLLGMPLLATPAEAGPGKDKPPAVKVMTRNLYLGADIMRPIRAIARAQAEHPGDLLAMMNAFGNANDRTRDIVEETDYETRVQLLAEEIATGRPDLIGLQEVALWRSGPFEDPLESETFLVPNATEVDHDFLKLLQAALREREVPYRVLSVNTLSDVEGPAFEEGYGSPDFANERDVRLTMRDVILMRKDSPVKYLKGTAKEATYAVNMPAIEVAGRSIQFERGYQWADLIADGRRFRFINTHLEAFSSDVAYAQAQELIDGPGAYRGRTIIVCDCNSDPANGTIKSAQGDTERHWAPYFLIKRVGGFHDTWLQWAPPEDGFTSGLSETVDDETAAGFDHRIDMVFARTGKGHRMKVLKGDVTGDDVADRDEETGLWPSDHAGVVMRLRLM